MTVLGSNVRCILTDAIVLVYQMLGTVALVQVALGVRSKHTLHLGNGVLASQFGQPNELIYELYTVHSLGGFA